MNGLILSGIQVDKEGKSNFKIYIAFNPLAIDKLNEFMSSELTANSNSVGSLILPKILKFIV